MLIWYLLIVSIGFLTTSTVAYYSDDKHTNGRMIIGTWESKESEKQIQDKKNDRIDTENDLHKEVAKSEQKPKSFQLEENEEETKISKENGEEPEMQSEGATEHTTDE